MIAPHWNLRRYLVEMRLDGDNPNTRHDARLYVLMAMICHADIRLRCWPSTATLTRETGYNSAAVVEARDWLLEKKAIVLVPHDKRVGDECNLPARQFVYQLTGMMETSDGLQPYLMVAPEVQAQVAAELERLEAEVLQTEVSHTEISVRKTKVLTSSKDSTSSKDDLAQSPSGAAQPAAKKSKPRKPAKVKTLADLDQLRRVIAINAHHIRPEQGISGRMMVLINMAAQELEQRFGLNGEQVSPDELAASYAWHTSQDGRPAAPKEAVKTGDMVAKRRAALGHKLKPAIRVRFPLHAVEGCDECDGRGMTIGSDGRSIPCQTCLALEIAAEEAADEAAA